MPRVLVYGLVTALVLVALSDATLWPLSGWRLFSSLRGPQAGSVAVVVETPRGESLLDSSELWAEYRSVGHAIASAERVGGRTAVEAVCEALAPHVLDREPDLVAVRFDRKSTRLVPGPDGKVVRHRGERSTLVRCTP